MKGQEKEEMKLLTHNLLRSNVKGVKKGFPLKIEAIKVEEKETEFNPEFVLSMLERIDWEALKNAALQMGPEFSVKLPAEKPENFSNDEEFLKLVHHALFEIILVEGFLICPESGRRFKVENAIPNMLLNEDEI